MNITNDQQKIDIVARLVKEGLDFKEALKLLEETTPQPFQTITDSITTIPYPYDVTQPSIYPYITPQWMFDGGISHPFLNRTGDFYPLSTYTTCVN